MAYLHSIQRLKEAAQGPQRGVQLGMAMILQSDLIELLRDWQRLDDAARSAHEANVAAQAGDEPMPGIEYEIELLPCVYPGTVPQLKTAYEAGHRHALRAAGEYVRQKLAAQVSPRATADVERNLRAELINEGALRQYCHNDGSTGFVTAYDFDITNRFLAAIATTKPGA